MKASGYRIAAVAAALLALATLPLAAYGVSEVPATGRRAPLTPEIEAFFETRGVESQYITLEESSVPAEQWQAMRSIVCAPDYDNPDDDQGVLERLVNDAFTAAAAGPGETLYLKIGGRVWRNTLF